MEQEQLKERQRLLTPSVALSHFDPARGTVVGLKPIIRQRVHYGFNIGDLGFLIEPDTVSEIVEQATIYPIPHTPSWIAGLINLRGNLVPVFDLKLYLKLGSTAQGRHYLLLLGTGEDMVGFFVENLPRPVDVNHKLNHPPPLPDVLRGYISDIYSFDKIVWMQFDHRGFFQSLALSVA